MSRFGALYPKIKACTGKICLPLDISMRADVLGGIYKPQTADIALACFLEFPHLC